MACVSELRRPNSCYLAEWEKGKNLVPALSGLQPDEMHH